MKRKIAYISIFFAMAIIMLSCSAYASNVLIISEEDVVHGETVATMLGKIAPNDFNIEEISIESGKSFAQVVSEITASGKIYDSVIVQLPSSSTESVVDVTSALNTLYTKLESTENTQCFIGTPAGKIANYTQEIETTKQNVKDIMVGMTATKVSSIPVYENLNTASSKSLSVYADNELTELGDLLVACTYSNSLGKQVTLKGYDGLSDEEVLGVVEVANGTESQVPDTPTTGTVVEEPTQEPEPEEKIEEDTDISEMVGSIIEGINREPIMEMTTADPTGLRIRIYDKEKEGIKTASLMVNDANGKRIEPERVDGESIKSYVFKINQELLSTEEYKQFYIYAEDNDGCILREYFRVKYVEISENGSNYKVNRAPRIRPKLFSDAELVKIDMISLYVMDQTGIQRVTPKTVAENGLKEVNLFADGNYNGYDGIEENYDWRDVKGKTTTSSKTYVKEAYTQFQDINEFFKYEDTESKVSLLLDGKGYRFNVHAVDATGLATDKIMIIGSSEKKKETSDGDDGVDKPSDETPTSSVDTTNTVNTNTTEIESTNTVENTNSNETDNTNTNTNTDTEEKGLLQESETTPSYADVRSDREPRLKYVASKDYLYIEIRDMAGIACGYPSIDSNVSYEAQKELEPKIYYYENDKRGEEVGVKRPVEADYKKYGKFFKYRIGMPITEFSEEFKKFEIVAYDVKSKTKQQFCIDEVFMVKKDADGEIVVNRAPTSNVVFLRDNWHQISLHACDGTGISTIEMQSLPKEKGKPNDSIRKWIGTVQSHWSAVTYMTTNGKYVKDGLTKFEKINTIFKQTDWIGQNPMVSGEDGNYIIMVTAADASGVGSVKTMKINTNYYVSGDEYIKIENKDTNSSDAESDVAKTSAKDNTTKEVKDPNNSYENTSENAEESNPDNSVEKNTENNSENNSNNTLENNTESEIENNSVNNTNDEIEKNTEESPTNKTENSSENNSESNTESDSSGSVEETSTSVIESELPSDSAGSIASGTSSDSEDILIVNTLKRGSEGVQVRMLQRRLIQIGYRQLNINGDYDAKTERAVRDFQKINELTVDGIVESKTIAMMNSKKYKGPKNKDYSGTYVNNLWDSRYIKALQRRLNDLEYGKLNVNGTIDKSTKEALNKFAKANGVTSSKAEDVLEKINSEDAKPNKN